MRWVRRLVPGLVAALVLLGAADHALAHAPVNPRLIKLTPETPPEPAPDLPAMPRAPGLPWPGALTFLATMAVWFYRPRRALAGTLAVCVAVLLLEIGIHSVHHGPDAHGDAACAVYSVAQHLTGTDVEIPDLAVLPVAFHQVVVVGVEPLLVRRSLGSIQGRAPPPDPLV